MASTGESRVLLGDIDATVELLSVDALGNHYFEFENNGEGTLYFSGYGKHSPVYSIQIRDVSGIWQRRANGFFCGTGLGTAVINPGESVFFEDSRNGEDVKVGIAVSTDPTLKFNTKVVWSGQEAKR